VDGEDRPPGAVEVPGEPGDPAEDVQRLDVEIRTLHAPGRDQPVYFVLHEQSSMSTDLTFLDIEIPAWHDVS
jgi:hypothetical protein